MKRMSRYSRLVVVSNRLPVTPRAGETGVQLASSSGGLAAGLRPSHEGTAGLWVGWPGDVSQLTADQPADLDSQLRSRRMVSVPCPGITSADDVAKSMTRPSRDRRVGTRYPRLCAEYSSSPERW